MLIVFTGILMLIAAGMIGLQIFTRIRQLNTHRDSFAPLPSRNRYTPMLRLLSDDDTRLLSQNKALAKKFRAQRVRLFRAYLRCLTKDYGRLLDGLRLAMVQSEVERPELTKALAVNKMKFVVALCRIELRLQLHSAGFGKVDVSGLVEAMDMLRAQVSFMVPSLSAAR